MIRFNSPAQWYKKNGLQILFFHLAVFIFGLPPFNFGTWIQTEPIFLFILIASVFTSLWLVIGLAKKWLVVESPVHPLIHILLLWALWQFIAAYAAVEPILAWLGPPQQAEGAALHVAMVLMAFLTMPLWDDESSRKKIFWAAVISVCVMTFLHFDMRMIHDPNKGTDQEYSFYREDNPLAPSNWPHYLAFIASWIWIAYGATPSLRSNLGNIIMTVIFIAVILISNNRSAYVLILPVFAVAGILIWLQSCASRQRGILKLFEAGRGWKLLAVVGIILPLSWIPLSSYYNFAETSGLYLDIEKHVNECKPEYRLLCKRVDITERAAFNVIAVKSMEHNPDSMLFGRGWGSYSSDLFTYDLLDGLWAFKDGKLDPNFESLDGFTRNFYDFHTHNQPLSALHASGIIGFILFTAIPVIAIIYLKRNLFWWVVPVLIGVNALGSLWFFMPQVVAFQALGLVAICAARKNKINNCEHISQCASAFPAFIMVLMAGSVFLQAQAIGYGLYFWKLKMANKAPVVYENNDWMQTDADRGGERFLLFTIDYIENLEEKFAEGKDKSITENDRDWYRELLKAAHEMGAYSKANVITRIAEAKLNMALLFDFDKPSTLDELKAKVHEDITGSIIRITEVAPQREDFIAQYLINLNNFTGGDINKQKNILEDILAVAPKHRSALWLLGAIYETTPALKDKGLAMRRQAVALGVVNVYPVTDEEIRDYR